MDDTTIERTLVDAQDALKAALVVADEARAQRQAAVMAALGADWSKYRIAKLLGVERPTVDSIIKTAAREAAK